MLCRISGVFTFGLLSYGLCGQASVTTTVSGKPDDVYWIVVPTDKISFRSAPAQAEQRLTAKYPVLRPSDEVFCSEDVVPVASKAKGNASGKPSEKPADKTDICELKYVTAYGSEKLATIPAKRWTLLSSISNLPEPKPVVTSSRDLLEEMEKKAQRAGLSKGSGCAGDLPVLAPACRDTIDMNDFTVEWSDPPGGGTYASLFLDTIDELQPQSIRLDRIRLEAHRYEDPRMKQFFEDVQKDSAPTNVVLRMSQSQGVEATRIVTIPSRIEQKGFHEQLEMVKAQQALFRNIALLSVYVNFGLWSKAGKQARELLALAPDEELVKTYALIGFCQSGYSREIEELRTSLKRLGITDICPAGQK